jgi:hypothetical protein
MSRRLSPRFSVLVLLAVLLAAPAAHGQDCQIGTRLGSTVLVPYFEYDPAGAFDGLTTLFSVTNESNQATLVRVVLWTDWGIPTLGFDVYLPMFDLQSFNVRDLFNGNVPSTGEGADLSGFMFCDIEAFRPFHSNPVLSGDEAAQIRASHAGTGGPLNANCAGENHGDGLIRGYVTLDTVDECSGVVLGSTFSPAWSGYFVDGGSGGIAIAQNRLWGDFLIVDPANAFAQGSEAVGLWADPARFAADPIFTFYGRYSGYDGRDERVPLPTLWATRFLNGGPFTGGADLIVWRDTGVATVAPVACGGHPAWHPLQEGFVVARDESGDPAQRIQVGTESNFFPLATQKVPVSTFGLPYAFGRLQLSLADGPNLNNPRQAWVQTVLSANGLYSAGMNARAIDELCDDAPP